MPDTPVTADVQIGVTFPGEALLVAIVGLLTEMIKGATSEQRAQMWDNWIRIWQPFIDAITPKKAEPPK